METVWHSLAPDLVRAQPWATARYATMYRARRASSVRPWPTTLHAALSWARRVFLSQVWRAALAVAQVAAQARPMA